MNTIEQKPNASAETLPKNELEVFRDRIREIKEIEMAKKRDWERRGMKGEAYDPHFDLINPECLGETEREVYDKYQDGTLTADEFLALRDLANEEYEKLMDGAEKTALNNFWAYLGNLVSVKEMKRQLEEMKRKK